jgi:hypothetical protein
VSEKVTATTSLHTTEYFSLKQLLRLIGDRHGCISTGLRESTCDLLDGKLPIVDLLWELIIAVFFTSTTTSISSS